MSYSNEANSKEINTILSSEWFSLEKNNIFYPKNEPIFDYGFPVFFLTENSKDLSHHYHMMGKDKYLREKNLH